MKDNQSNTLDTLSSDQQHIFVTYNAPPVMHITDAIPFVDIANKYISSGSYYPP